MADLLHNPLFQSGLLPLLSAALLISLLRPLGWQWHALAFSAALLIAVYFINGLQFTPLTSTRKIIIVALAATLLGLLRDMWPRPQWGFAILVAVAGAAAMLWIAWPVLTRLQGAAWWQAALPPAIYGAWLCLASEGLRNRNLPASAAALALSLGTALSALLGASALLGQLGGAAAAASGAWFLHAWLGRPAAAGSTFLLPLMALNAGLACAASIYASLPWQAPALLALAPLLARLPLPAGWTTRWRLPATTAAALAPALAAIWFTWREAGPPLF